jgi:hypothetical protein
MTASARIEDLCVLSKIPGLDIEQTSVDRSRAVYDFKAEIVDMTLLREWVTTPLMLICLILQYIRYVALNRFLYRFEQVKFVFVCGADEARTPWFMWSTLFCKDLIPHVCRLQGIWQDTIKITFSFRNPFPEELVSDGFHDDERFRWFGEGLDDQMPYGVNHDYTDFNMTDKIYKMGFRFYSSRFFRTACVMLMHVLEKLLFKYLHLRSELVEIELSNYCSCAPAPRCVCGATFSLTRFGPLAANTVSQELLHQKLFQCPTPDFNIYLPFQFCVRVCQD